MTDFINPNLINNITAEKIRTYMNFNGWLQNKDFCNNKLMVFDKVLNKESFNIALPSSEKLDDFYSKLPSFIQTLCLIEDRDILKILHNISKPNVDQLQFRVIADFSNEGLLPLNYASEMISGIRDLIISAACTEENPRPFFKKASSSAKNYGDTFKFGQTEKGSFIITIESDILESIKCQNYVVKDNAEISCEAPFSRRVMSRIQSGISKVEKLSSEGKLDEIFKEGYKQGLSANMCDALLNFNKTGRSIKIESKMKWAISVPPPEDVPEEVTINDNGFLIMEAISKAYKEETIERNQIKGYIVNLSAKIIDAENENSDRTVTIKWVHEGKTNHIKVFLGTDEYKQACKAHIDGFQVAVTGDLDKKSKSWKLLNPEQFKVI